jgi:hypothetical protein
MTDVLSFEIRGLNGRELPLSYDLDRQVNIFFGPNGSGKTSLLRILHSAMRNEPELISNISFQSVDVKIHSITFDRSILLSYTKSTEICPWANLQWPNPPMMLIARCQRSAPEGGSPSDG